jgi:hypothetical protein
MSPLNEAIAAAEEFIRWARYSLDRPRPDVLATKIEAAIEKLEALLDEVR